MTVTRLLDDDGRHTGWIRIATDVTAEEAARRALEAAGERWRGLVDLLPRTTVLVVGADLRYRLALGAETAARTASCSRAGRSPRPRAPPTPPSWSTLYRDALRGRPGRVELPAAYGERDPRRPRGPAARPGRRAEALVVAQDVTAERERETALRRALERSARLFEEAPHGTLLLGRGRGRQPRSNPALCALLGLPRCRRCSASHLAELPFSLDDVPEHLAALLRPAGRGGSRSRRTLRSPVRPVVDVALTAVRLRGDGRRGRGRARDASSTCPSASATSSGWPTWPTTTR